MPREWKEILRISDVEEPLRIFVIAYEGTVAEPKYFEALKEDSKFNDEIIHLEPLRRNKKDGRSDPKNVFNVLRDFYNDNKEHYNFKEKDEFWMIIDRDSWECLSEIVDLCKSENNFFMALSNLCFEFWLLLHVVDLDSLTEDEKNNLLLNEKVSSNKNYIDAFLSEKLSNGYNKRKPKIKRFIPNIHNAVSRAKSLDDISEDYPSGLGSHVYKIVEKITK